LATASVLAIVVFVGGYFFLVETEQLFGHYGVAINMDNRWAFLLLMPIAQLLRGAWKGYRSAADSSGKIGNYLLGAGVLVLALLVFVVDGLSDSAVWRAVMVLGGLVVVGELLQRAASALRSRVVSANP